MNPKHRRPTFPALLFLLSFLVSGCWDVVDLDRRTIVMGLGLDATPDNHVLATAQIPLVETAPGLFGGPLAVKPFHTITSLNQTTMGATYTIEDKTVKRLYLGQLKIVVVNTALAQKGLKHFSDFLLKHPDIPPISWSALTETTAREILSVELNSKYLPANALDTAFYSKSKSREVFPVKTWQFLKALEAGPTDAYLPIIAFDPVEKAFSITRIGVFHRERLVGEFSAHDSQALAILQGKSSYAVKTFPLGNMGEIFFRRITSRTRITVQKTQPRITFLVSVKAKGYDPGMMGNKEIYNAADFAKIEKITVRTLEKELTKVIRDLQQMNSDILGFGDTLRATRPQVWKSLRWDRVYPQTRIRVKVNFSLQEGGRYH